MAAALLAIESANHVVQSMIGYGPKPGGERLVRSGLAVFDVADGPDKGFLDNVVDIDEPLQIPFQFGTDMPQQSPIVVPKQVF
jgi:hypothetical protein